MGQGFIPPEFIEELLARVDIVDIINTRVPLKRAGNSHKACCPFHQEKSPSFMVNQSKQIYHCFGCGAKGNVINFMMEYERLEFIETIEYLAHHEGMVIPYEKSSTASYRDKTEEKSAEGLLYWLSLADLYFQQQLRQNRDKERAVDYLKLRGITGEDALKFNIGFASDEWGGLLAFLKDKGAKEASLIEAGLVIASSDRHCYDRFRDRIMFPIRNRKGETIGFGGRILGNGEPKYLNSPESPVFIKGKELYGLYELRKHVRHYTEIIVVEGYMDVVMLAHFGIQNVVATLGTATSTKQVELLFRHTQKIVFCFDGDEAGQNAAFKAMVSALPVLNTGKELGFLFLPKEDDPDSFVRQYGKEAFIEKVQGALPLSEYLFSVFEGRFDIRSLEGRSMILKEVGLLINQMPDTSLRDLLRLELASRTEVQASILDRHVQKGKITRSISRGNERSVGKNLIERALVILLNDFSIVQEFEGYDFLLENGDKKAHILYQVVMTLLDYPQIKNVAQLLVIFQEEPWLAWLEQLSFYEMTLDKNLYCNEFKDLLSQLAEQNNPRKQALLKLAQGISLTEEEKKALK